MFDLGSGGWAGVLAVILSGLFGGAGGFLLKWKFARREDRKLTHEQSRETRAENRSDFERVIEFQDRKIARLEKQIDRLTEQHEECRRDHMAALIAHEQLKGQARLQEAAIRHLQAQTGTYPTGLTLPALITAKEGGEILECSPSVSAMFHYLGTELVGRNVADLIPPRYRDAHSAKMREAARVHQVPWPDRAIVGYGLTREGTEFPITITLSGWRGDDGRMLYQAEIHYRRARLPEEGSGEHVPLPQGPSGVYRFETRPKDPPDPVPPPGREKQS